MLDSAIAVVEPTKPAATVGGRVMPVGRRKQHWRKSGFIDLQESKDSYKLCHGATTEIGKLLEMLQKTKGLDVFSLTLLSGYVIEIQHVPRAQKLRKCATYKSEGISVDVVENKCRKNVTPGISRDVVENK
jgi:hypothetical protein